MSQAGDVASRVGFPSDLVEVPNLQVESRGKSRTFVGVFLLGALLLAALLDFPARVAVGPTTLSAALTVLVTVVAALLWITQPVMIYRAFSLLWPLIMVVGLGISSFLFSEPSLPGIQGIIILVAFLLVILLAARETWKTPDFAARLYKMMKASGLLAMLLTFISVVAMPLIGFRQFALFALLVLAWTMSAWSYGSVRGKWYSAAILVLIGLTLSRLGFIAGLILLALAQLQPGSFRTRLRVIGAILFAALVAYIGLTYVGPVRDRFFEFQEVSALSVGPFEINSEGRGRMWETTIGSWQEAPWFGHGMGSAAVLMEETYGLEHPHNDYLRILHDLGLVGLSLWVLGLLKLLSHEYRQWRWEHYTQHKSEAIVHKAAFLSLAAFMMSMATDNSVSYLFVMVPLGITLGASAGLFSSRAST